jgi:FkbM family methyltransferase
MIGLLDSIRIGLNRFLIRAIKLISSLRLTADSRVYWTRHLRERPWLRDGGEVFKKTDFNFLDENSLIIEVGGFTGDFIAPLFCKYNCEIITYEPVPEFYTVLAERFRFNKKVTAVNEAVGAANGLLSLNVGSAGTSMFLTPENNKGKELVVKVSSILDIVGKTPIVDLLALNCEGSEYEILNALSNDMLTKRIRCIFVQFHEVEDVSPNKKDSVMAKLLQTHELSYDYPWVWTRFDLRS